jgi:heat shock protein HslJ
MMKLSLFRSRRAKVTLALAAAMVLGLAGCAGTESGPGSGRPVPLEKTYWKVVDVEGISEPPGAGQRDAHLVFDAEKKRVTGYSGVNSFFGGYDTSGGGLRMSHMASTRRAGSPELMHLESAFLKALSATRSYRITGDRLELRDSNERVLARFQAERLSQR